MGFLTNDKLTIVGAAGMIGSNMAQTAMMLKLTPNICLYAANKTVDFIQTAMLQRYHAEAVGVAVIVVYATEICTYPDTVLTVYEN